MDKPPDQPSIDTHSTGPATPQAKAWSFRVAIFLIMAGIAVLSVVPRLIQSASSKLEDTIGWRTDFDEAARLSAAEGKPILLKFTADWCGPCQQMKRSVFSDPQVASMIRGRFVPVVVDLTRANGSGGTIADRYEVQVLPTLIVLGPDRQAIAKKHGFTDKSQLIRWLDPLASQVPNSHSPTNRYDNH